VEQARGPGDPAGDLRLLYNDIPADDPFWDVVIGDPGIPNLFHGAVYVRGAMTLQVVRDQVGDRDFFRILRAWAKRRSGGNGSTAQFVALAERISGQQLDEPFDAWLFTPGKPTFGAPTAVAAAMAGATATASAARTPPAAASLLERLAKGGSRLGR
jgi:aminopeptidase N